MNYDLLITIGVGAHNSKGALATSDVAEAEIFTQALKLNWALSKSYAVKSCDTHRRELFLLQPSFLVKELCYILHNP